MCTLLRHVLLETYCSSRALWLCASKPSIGLITAAAMLAGPDVSAALQADMMFFYGCYTIDWWAELSFMDAVETLRGLCASRVVLANINNLSWVLDLLLATDLCVHFQMWSFNLHSLTRMTCCMVRLTTVLCLKAVCIWLLFIAGC